MNRRKFAKGDLKKLFGKDALEMDVRISDGPLKNEKKIRIDWTGENLVFSSKRDGEKFRELVLWEDKKNIHQCSAYSQEKMPHIKFIKINSSLCEKPHKPISERKNSDVEIYKIIIICVEFDEECLFSVHAIHIHDVNIELDKDCGVPVFGHSGGGGVGRYQ